MGILETVAMNLNESLVPSFVWNENSIGETPNSHGCSSTFKILHVISRAVLKFHMLIMSWSDDDNKNLSWSYCALVIIIAAFCGGCNYHHVSTMFENDRHFSHLSSLERDMTFRTEMGLYYSYYKRLVLAPSFLSGLNQIMNDNLTEYPSTINTLQRFNLYPEVILGAAYRIFIKISSTLGIKTKECWQVDRGSDLPPVWSCEGLGDPSYFYISGVWLCAGATAALIFIYGLFLSESTLGGIIAIISFFFNHSECTRVQWTPPLRESFGYPMILAQMLSVSWCLRQKLPHWKHLVMIAVTTSASLVTWQFSQFVFLTQVIGLTILWLQNQAPRPTIVVIFLGKLVGLQNAVLLLFANEMLLTSFYACAVLVILAMILFLPSSFQQSTEGFSLKWSLLYGVLIVVGTFLLRSGLILLLGAGDDAHIFNLLRAKFSSFRDFHTFLYICAAEFDFLSPTTLFRLSKTLLLPSVYVSLGLVAVYAMGLFDSDRETEKRTASLKKNRHSVRREKHAAVNLRKVDAAVLYNVLQLVAFVLMAALIMRLKLFMSPHLCIVAGLLASRKYVAFVKTRLVHLALVVALISAMSVAGVNNLHDQRSIIGEYSNPELEELIHWIVRETPKDAAFAGPMPLMASILLTTQRPVVNHPHYEDSGLRERTRKVYRAFGRGTVDELYRILVDLKVSYLVLGDQWCFGETRPGCSMLDIWDAEEPQRKDRSPLCPVLFEGNASPLQRVFINDGYVVLRVPSRYVEVTLPRQYRQ